MKKLLVLAFFILWKVSGFSQIYLPSNQTGYGSHLNRLLTDSTLHIPRFYRDYLTHTSVDSPQIRINDNQLQYYMDGVWYSAGSTSGGGEDSSSFQWRADSIYVKTPPTAFDGMVVLIASSGTTSVFVGNENKIATYVAGDWEFQDASVNDQAIVNLSNNTAFYKLVDTGWKRTQYLMPIGLLKIGAPVRLGPDDNRNLELKTNAKIRLSLRPTGIYMPNNNFISDNGFLDLNTNDKLIKRRFTELGVQSPLYWFNDSTIGCSGCGGDVGMPGLQQVTDINFITSHPMFSVGSGTQQIGVYNSSGDLGLGIIYSPSFRGVRFSGVPESKGLVDLKSDSTTGDRTHQLPDSSGTLGIAVTVNGVRTKFDKFGNADLGTISSGVAPLLKISGAETALGDVSADMDGNDLTINNASSITHEATDGTAFAGHYTDPSTSDLYYYDDDNDSRVSSYVGGIQISANGLDGVHEIIVGDDSIRINGLTSQHLSNDSMLVISSINGSSIGRLGLRAIPSGGTSGVTSIATTSPITGGTITSTGTMGLDTTTTSGGWHSRRYYEGLFAPLARTINTTSPLSGGGDLTVNRTITIADAAADGSTKGAASFTANDFDASSGNISIDYTNGQSASGSNKGFLTSTDWTTFNNKLSTATAASTYYPLTGGAYLSATNGTGFMGFHPQTSAISTPVDGFYMYDSAGITFLRSDGFRRVLSFAGISANSKYNFPTSVTADTLVTRTANQTLTNKSGSNLQWTNDAGFITQWKNICTTNWNSGNPVAASTTTYVLAAGLNAAFSTTEINRQVMMPTSGTIRNLAVRTASAQPSSGNLIFTIRKNGSPTAITITVNSSGVANSYYDNTNSVSFVQGDLISIEIVNAATSSSADIRQLSYVITN